MNKNFELKIKNSLLVFFVIWLLSLPFSFAWEPDFWQTLKSRASLPLWNVYVADFTTLFFLLATVIYLFWHKKLFLALKSKIFSVGLFFALLAPISTLWSGSPALSFFWGMRLLVYFLAIFIASYLIKNSFQFKNIFLKSIVAIGIIESVIVIVQFFLQHSIGLWFLGESLIGKDIPGLAKIWIGPFRLIRAYGTLPHPNILGGFLLFTIVGTLKYLYFSKRNRFVGTQRAVYLLAIQLVALGLTFSRSAILGLLLIILLSWKVIRKLVILGQTLNPTWFRGDPGIQKKIFVTVLLFLIPSFLLRSPIQNILNGSDPATRLRMEYSKAALERFKSAPLLGRGWATGPEELPAFSHFPFYSWERQPAHNIYLLVLSDLGMAGFVIFTYFIYRILSYRYVAMLRTYEHNIWKGLFIAYLAIGLFDHYLLTLPQGIFIFFLSAFLLCPAECRLRRLRAGTCGLTRKKEKNPRGK